MWRVRMQCIAPRSRRMICARFSEDVRPLKKEGAGKTGCALHPRSRVQNCAKKRTRAYRFGGNTPAFPAQWYYDLYRALPGDRLVATVTSRALPQNLTPASGRQNHTTSPSASRAVRRQHIRGHRIPPRVRDVRTPLLSGETGELIALICPTP